MKNVLLPTDFSENSWNAILYALNFFKNEKCNLYLLHVNKISNLTINDSPYILTQEVIEEVYNKPSKAQLKKLLRKISEQVPNNKKHNFYTITDYNFFIESIRNHVSEKKIDLIVMGTKGATGLKKLIVGSNTADIITKVKCATLVVPENANYVDIKEVAYPTDFSLLYGIETLQPIADILDTYNSSIRILHICKKGEELNTSQKKSKELLEDFFIHHKYSFHFLTNKRVEDAVQCFVESMGVNMIVMVAKNLNYFQQILFHDKIEEISYHTDVPFLVLHE
ncbi:universal stress protein [Aquaticitalea lipolytica]|uniref:universal stress protein n=1 Tax=Aquaticitalea lipolytica TaxID=1247562 RepID=UPI0024B9822C|nr:universal stress protein [Aquaticitalea lipolytica]